MSACDCTCHTNPVYGECSEPGGCGSIGCVAGQIGERRCVVCPVYGREPEACETPQVCRSCRSRLAHGLALIPEQAAKVTAAPGAGMRVRISGTLEKPLGVRVSALDQLAQVPELLAARLAVGYTDHLEPKVETRYETRVVRELDRDQLHIVEVEREIQVKEIDYSSEWTVETHPSGVGRVVRRVPREWVEAGDQTGEVPVAAWLDSCVRDWMAYRPEHREHLPVPTVDRLTDWLGDRLGWACDYHPDVQGFAAELKHALGVLRAVNGEVTARPEVKIGVECKFCDSRSSLTREAGDDWIECEDCKTLYSPDEYEEWVGRLAGHAKQHYRYHPQAKTWLAVDEGGAA